MRLSLFWLVCKSKTFLRKKKLQFHLIMQINWTKRKIIIQNKMERLYFVVKIIIIIILYLTVYMESRYLNFNGVTLNISLYL